MKTATTTTKAATAKKITHRNILAIKNEARRAHIRTRSTILHDEFDRMREKRVLWCNFSNCGDYVKIQLLKMLVCLIGKRPTVLTRKTFPNRKNNIGGVAARFAPTVVWFVLLCCCCRVYVAHACTNRFPYFSRPVGPQIITFLLVFLCIVGMLNAHS